MRGTARRAGALALAGVVLAVPLTAVVTAPADAATVTVTTWEALNDAFVSGASSVTLGADITGTDADYLPMESTDSLTLDLNGHALSLAPTVAEPGILVPGGARLTIDDGSAGGTGTLVVTGGVHSAGIGGTLRGETGTVVINGGTITATGSPNSAGIGAGVYGTSGEVDVNGGSVIASGNTGGAGIGGSVTTTTGDGGVVKISGGTVKATGSTNGAGIGGGAQESGARVTISGGSVTAIGGANAAAIGGGVFGDSGSVLISGGTVIANGGGSGAGIGSGNGGHSPSDPAHSITVNANAFAGTGTTGGTGSDGGPGSTGGVGSAIVSGAGDWPLSYKADTVNASGGAVQITFGGALHFDAAGGVPAPSDQFFAVGAPASAPTVTLDGHSFAGWYAAGASSPSVFPYTVIGDETFTAQWVAVTHTVSFDAAGGSSVSSQTVDDGDPATEPADPTRSGFTFMGWFAPAAAVPFDFSTPIAADLTLTAQWDPIPVVQHTVSFDAAGGPAEASQVVDDGGVATKPTDPTRFGFVFVGWFAPAAAVPFDFSTPIVADLVLTAHWTAPVIEASATNSGGHSVITVTGSGFLPGETVTVVLHSDPIVLGVLVADASGIVSGSFSVPDGVPAGDHTVIATGSVSGAQTSLALVVPALISSPPPMALPETDGSGDPGATTPPDSSDPSTAPAPSAAPTAPAAPAASPGRSVPGTTALASTGGADPGSGLGLATGAIVLGGLVLVGTRLRRRRS